jgi:hypothetical protein
MKIRIEVSPYKKYIPPNSAIKKQKTISIIEIKNIKLLIATTIIT